MQFSIASEWPGVVIGRANWGSWRVNIHKTSARLVNRSVVNRSNDFMLCADIITFTKIWFIDSMCLHVFSTLIIWNLMSNWHPPTLIGCDRLKPRVFQRSRVIIANSVDWQFEPFMYLLNVYTTNFVHYALLMMHKYNIFLWILIHKLFAHCMASVQGLIYTVLYA